MNKKILILVLCILPLAIFSSVTCKTIFNNNNVALNKGLTNEQKKKIADKLLSEFYYYDEYLKTHKLNYTLHDAAVQEKAVEYAQALENEYISAKMYDCLIGLTGVYRDDIDEKDLDYIKGIKDIDIDSEVVSFGYTKSGYHIICFHSMESKAEYAFNKIPLKFMNEYNDSKINSEAVGELLLRPKFGKYFYLYMYVEDLTQKVKSYDISIQMRGYPSYDNSYNNSENVIFNTKTIISNEEKEFVSKYNRKIETGHKINDRNWALYSIENKDYKFLGISNINISLNNETIELE